MLMTAHGSMEVAQSALRLKADDLLLKPLDRVSFVERLRGLPPGGLAIRKPSAPRRVAGGRPVLPIPSTALIAVAER